MERFEQPVVERDLRKEKPKVVYHGSPEADLEDLQPNQLRTREKSEGPVVFATSDLAFATTFLSPRPDDSWSSKGYLNGVCYILISDESRFRQGDHGGVIYEMPGDSFSQEDGKGMDVEWVANESVKPTHAIRYESSLDAMIGHGVQVYFADQHTLEKLERAIREDEDHGLGILESLQSENQKRGENVKSFR